MSTLVFGDIHAKTSLLEQGIKQAIEQEKPSKIIFLGDYFDDWGIDWSLNLEEAENLVELKSYLKSKGIETSFLCGNHDYSYINTFMICSGHEEYIEENAKNILLNKLKVQIAEEEKGYLLTHAGLRNDWSRKYIGDTNDPKIIKESLNNMFKESLTILNEIKTKNDQFEAYKKEEANQRSPLISLCNCGYKRGGYDLTPGPLWTDKDELLDHHINCNQIVGHTPVDKCFKFVGKDNSKIWFCDTISYIFRKCKVYSSEYENIVINIPYTALKITNEGYVELIYVKNNIHI